jgi:N-formylglutamate deformylase
MTIVLHIPHSSKEIPPDIRPSLVLSDEELETELVRLTDSYTGELYDCRMATRIIFPVSRLVVDPERFLDDSAEPMSEAGMGAVYLCDSRGQTLRSTLSPGQRDELIQKYYVPHHSRLADAVSSALADQGRCLIVDCHSFRSVPFKYEKDRSPRPDICLGTDDYHTPASLRDSLVELFLAAGLTVDINSPFPGTMVPQPYYHTDERVHSIMIEVNRSLCMDEDSGERNFRFKRMQDRLAAVLSDLAGSFSRNR